MHDFTDLKQELSEELRDAQYGDRDWQIKSRRLLVFGAMVLIIEMYEIRCALGDSAIEIGEDLGVKRKRSHTM